MGIVASLFGERSQDGDQAKAGVAPEGDPSNPPPPVEPLQPLHWRPERGAEDSAKEDGRSTERGQGDSRRVEDAKADATLILSLIHI